MAFNRSDATARMLQETSLDNQRHTKILLTWQK